MKTQVHHKTPRCRGGTDDPENLVELSLYEHAEVHALDYVNGGIEFDCRNPFWKILQIENPELASQVLEEKARRMAVKMTAANLGVPKSLEHAQKLREHLNEKCLGHFTGRCHTEDTKKRMSDSMKSRRARCTVTGFETTPGALTRYQQSRGIDPSNRIQIS
jgi:hypothetical protein